MKRGRLVVNIAVAGVLALLAYGVQSGALAELTDTALAATGGGANCGTMASSPASGDTLQVCGLYTGTIGATVVVTVTQVNRSGRITGVFVNSDAGQLGPYGSGMVSPTSGVVSGVNTFGQTYTFLLDGKNNKVGDAYTFGEKPHCQVKSKC